MHQDQHGALAKGRFDKPTEGEFELLETQFTYNKKPSGLFRPDGFHCYRTSGLILFLEDLFPGTHGQADQAGAEEQHGGGFGDWGCSPAMVREICMHCCVVSQT